MSHAISPATAQQAPTAPPGLPARQNAWEGGAASYPTHPPGLAVPGNSADRAGKFRATSWDSIGASTSSPDSDSGPDLTTATESDNPHNVHIYFSESMEEEFHGMGIRAIEMEDEEALRELDSIAPGVWEEPTGVAAWETTPAGWDEDALDAEDHWKQNQETATPMLCKAHGTICKKGICIEYAKQVRLTKRAAEEEERRKAASASKGKKGGRAKGRGAGKKDENENESSGRNTMQDNPFRGPGAPVKTNWRGAPRAIVSANAIEKRETAKADSDDGWGNSDPEEPNAAAVVPGDAADTASNVSWGISEDAYDPFSAPAQQVPVTKANRSGGKPQGKKKPGQAMVSSNWADEVDAELTAGRAADTFTTISSKRGSKRGTSTTSRGTSTAKSSTSGWGSVAQADMPW
jgi:hypothetical protein